MKISGLSEAQATAGKYRYTASTAEQSQNNEGEGTTVTTVHGEYQL